MWCQYQWMRKQDGWGVKLMLVSAALPSSLELTLTKETGSGLSHRVLLSLLILFSPLPHRSRLSSPTADWVNRGEAELRGWRERGKYSNPARAAFGHLWQHAGTQKGIFCYVLLTRKSVTGEENKVVESWEISKRKQKYVQWKQTDQNKRRAPLTSEREHISGEDWRQHCQKSFYHFLKKLLIGIFFFFF